MKGGDTAGLQWSGLEAGVLGSCVISGNASRNFPLIWKIQRSAPPLVVTNYVTEEKWRNFQVWALGVSQTGCGRSSLWVEVLELIQKYLFFFLSTPGRVPSANSSPFWPLGCGTVEQLGSSIIV